MGGGTEFANIESRNCMSQKAETYERQRGLGFENGPGGEQMILRRFFLDPLFHFFCWSQFWRPALSPIESFRKVTDIETKQKGGSSRQAGFS